MQITASFQCHILSVYILKIALKCFFIQFEYFYLHRNRRKAGDSKFLLQEKKDDFYFDVTSCWCNLIKTNECSTIYLFSYFHFLEQKYFCWPVLLPASSSQNLTVTTKGLKNSCSTSSLWQYYSCLFVLKIRGREVGKYMQMLKMALGSIHQTDARPLKTSNLSCHVCIRLSRRLSPPLPSAQL